MIGKDELKALLEGILDERESSEHYEEHEWIRERIKVEQARKRMYRQITKTAISWSVPFLLTGVVYWLQTWHWPQP
jgi:hypothetical protein